MSRYRSQSLFSEVDWHSVEEGQKSRLTAEIDEMDGNRLLNTSVDDLVAYLTRKFEIEVPVLNEEGIVADQRETEVDVSRDWNRDIRDRSRPFAITGTAIEVTIPFTGDSQVFRMRPSTSTLSPPRAQASSDHLTFTIEGVNLDPGRVRAQIDRDLAEIRTHLERLRQHADALQKQLPGVARNRIDQRRKKLLADQNLVSALGFPLKERDDAPRTYVAPEVRRRITPRMPTASTAPYKPEPVLDMADYEHILSVMTNMALVMERSPSAFESMDEEALRSHFLVQLNGHYQGDASGETFNYEGKTDILIRDNGKNIFIAECKYWRGPKKLEETIDQILGYTSWRDTKIAIVIFNRQKNFTRVLDAIPDVMASHGNFKRDLGKTSETSFRYVFSHRDDPNRELTLTVLAFDVPRAA